ncbi:12241_t:CDS:1, partial [Acaulospora colombiana]
MSSSSSLSIQRTKTYSKRSRSHVPTDTSRSTPATPSKKRKRTSDDENDDSKGENRVFKRANTFKTAYTSIKKGVSNVKPSHTTRKPLQQLVLAFSAAPSLVSCPLCDLSYTRGAPDDEDLHKIHCPRVMRGTEWGREEEREALKANVSIIESRIELSNGQHGRIISIPGSTTGKIGSK